MRLFLKDCDKRNLFTINLLSEPEKDCRDAERVAHRVFTPYCLPERDRVINTCDRLILTDASLVKI